MRFPTIEGGLNGPKPYRWREQRDAQLPMPTLAVKNINCRLKVMARIYTPRDRVDDIVAPADAIMATRMFYEELPFMLRHADSLGGCMAVEGVMPLPTGNFEMVVRLGWRGYFFQNETEIQHAYSHALEASNTMGDYWLKAGWDIFVSFALAFGYEDKLPGWVHETCLTMRIRAEIDGRTAKIGMAT